MLHLAVWRRLHMQFGFILSSFDSMDILWDVNERRNRTGHGPLPPGQCIHTAYDPQDEHECIIVGFPKPEALLVPGACQ
jgi:hypothetical protein